MKFNFANVENFHSTTLRYSAMPCLAAPPSSGDLRTSVFLRRSHSTLLDMSLFGLPANVLPLGLSLRISMAVAPPPATTATSALRLFNLLGLTGGFFLKLVGALSDPVCEHLLAVIGTE